MEATEPSERFWKRIKFHLWFRLLVMSVIITIFFLFYFKTFEKKIDINVYERSFCNFPHEENKKICEEWFNVCRKSFSGTIKGLNEVSGIIFCLSSNLKRLGYEEMAIQVCNLLKENISEKGLECFALMYALTNLTISESYCDEISNIEELNFCHAIVLANYPERINESFGWCEKMKNKDMENKCKANVLYNMGRKAEAPNYCNQISSTDLKNECLKEFG